KLGFEDVTFFPISALKGTNVVQKSPKTPWFEGHTVLEYLESVPVTSELNFERFRFPVQYVLRPNLNYRGFAGEVTSGIIRVGDPIVVLPSGKKTRVEGIDTYDGKLEEAFPPQSVTLRLEEEIDISRGDMIVREGDLPRVDRKVEAHLVWMTDRPLDTEKAYLVKHACQTVRAQIERIEWKMDMDTLEHVDATTLELNDIGRVRLNCHRALYFDDHREVRGTGSFIVIDSLTNNTVGAGMIVDTKKERQDADTAFREIRAGSGLEPKTLVSPTERLERLGQRGTAVWLTGLPGSGRWPLAYALERRLFDLGRTATVIVPVDEDLRTMISATKACVDAGLVTICAYPTFKVSDRDEVEGRVGDDRFVEIYVNTSEAICRERRPDASFEGFEVPPRPDATVSLDQLRTEKAVQFILETLERRGRF
ncbi:MAG: hypothetical protein KC416_09490, partial [Myxococcales bacterium]|nr:hypothetical protein [Myxococcales bacterium]